MNRAYCILVISILAISCKSKRSFFPYADSRQEYLAKYESVSQPSILSLYSKSQPEKLIARGKFTNNVKEGIWEYYFENGVKEIKWDLYADEHLGFIVNVPDNVDSIKKGDNYTKFLINTNHQKIVLSVFVDNYIKDSLPEKRYREITERAYKEMGIKTTLFNEKVIQGPVNKVFTHEINLVTPEKSEKHLMSAHGFTSTQNHFIEISVVADQSAQKIVDEIFEGVLCSFYFKPSRFYDPFRQE